MHNINQITEGTLFTLQQDIKDILKEEKEIVLSRRRALMEDGKLDDSIWRDGFYVSRIYEEYTASRSPILNKVDYIYNSNIMTNKDKLKELHLLYLDTKFDIDSKIAGRSGPYDKGKYTDYILSDEEKEYYDYRKSIKNKINKAKEIGFEKGTQDLKADAMSQCIIDANKLTIEVKQDNDKFFKEEQKLKSTQGSKPIIENKFYTAKDKAILNLSLKPEKSILKKDNEGRENRDKGNIRFNVEYIEVEKKELLKERKSNKFYTNEFMIENRKNYFINKKDSFIQRCYAIFKKPKQNRPLQKSVYL